METTHYFTGYDRVTGAIRREHPVPRRAVGAVRDLVGMTNGDCAREVEADLVPIVGFAIDLVIPLHECDDLDWFVDIYSRD
jgi:hypothetical protein